MKYSQTFKNVYAGLFFAAVILLSACTKDAIKYDVTGDTVNRVYVLTPTSYNNMYNFAIVQTPVSSIGTVSLSLSARSTMVAAADVKVTFAIDNSLVSNYNKAHATGYLPLPDSLFYHENNIVTIHQGDVCSTLRMNLNVIDSKMQYLTNPGYVIPIKIAAINSTDNNTAVSSNLSIVYVVITTTSTNCYNSPLITDMVGAIVTPRTGWAATLDATLNSGTLANMFDAKTNTYWYVTPAKEVNLVVNLSKAYTNIKGIRIHSYSTSYSLTSVLVYTSSDNINWTSQGIASLSGANSYQYIKFYSPIPTAQYIKLDVKGWKSGTYVIMAEFDIYQ